MTGLKGDDRCQGLNRLEVVGNARLFNQTHELLLNGGWVVSDVYV